MSINAIGPHFSCRSLPADASRPKQDDVLEARDLQLLELWLALPGKRMLRSSANAFTQLRSCEEAQVTHAHQRHRLLRSFALTGVAWAAGAMCFFRFSFLSGFDLVPGDRLDARVIIYLHEHLFRALFGIAQIVSPSFYYPQNNVLGYSDAFILDILPYSALRALGFDSYTSILVMFILLSIMCFASTAIIFAKYFCVTTPLVLCGAVLVTFPNNLYFKTEAGHLNFFAIYYIPSVLLLVFFSLSGFPRISFRSIIGIAAAFLLFALLFATGYYTAWMFAFTASIALLATAIASPSETRRFVSLYARPLVVLSSTAMISFAIGLVPFILIYAPVEQLFPNRSFYEYIVRAPVPLDIFNVSAWNLVWGSPVNALLGSGAATNVEQALAITPGMTLVFLAFALAAVIGKLNSRADSHRIRLLSLASLSVFAGAWLLTCKIDTYSGFWLIFQMIPGAGAIRAGERVQLSVSLWVVCALILLIDRWIENAPDICRRRRRLLASALLAFCILEQVNLRSNNFARAAELAQLAVVPPPPQLCQSFMVSNFGAADEVDAMWIALKVGLPTLNGRSGGSPPGWHLGDASDNYIAAAKLWIARNRLSGQVCLYDEKLRKWSFLQ